MKYLKKIILLQWYLFEAQEINIVGDAAIIGANGSGKSSIIDAVQTVLSGGDKNRISLNKGSNEKSSRSIKEYCLGVVSDPNSFTRVEPRPSANTYIVLCFHDTDKDEDTCAGMSIWATDSDPKEDIKGYFITRGQSLSLDDFTENTSSGYSVLPWNRVKDHLLRKFSLGRDFQQENCTLLLPLKGPGDFMRQFYTVMSAEPALPMASDTIVKALLAAIAFKPIDDPTLFVRRNMLEKDNIDIAELRSSLDFWREFKQKAQMTANCISELEILAESCEKVEKTQSDILVHEYGSMIARVEDCIEKTNPIEEQLFDLEEDLERIGNELEQIRTEKTEVDQMIGRLQAEYENRDTAQKIKTVEGNIKSLKKDKASLDNELNNYRFLGNSLECFDKCQSYLSKDLTTTVTDLLSKVSIKDDLLSNDWLRHADRIDTAASKLLGHYYKDGSQHYIDRQIQELWTQIAPRESDQKQRERTIQQLSRNQSPLQEKTLKLMALLKSEGIPATPLCDLIDVTDENWRNTIESILGNIREALIVPPELAQKAIKLYRYEADKSLRGSYIVNTTKTTEWLFLDDRGSLAEVIAAENEHASAFIKLRLGNIMRVETESELLKEKRAATADLMLNSGGVVTRINEPPLLILGRENRKAQLSRLKKIFESTRESLNHLKSKQNNLSRFAKILADFCERHQGKANFYTENATTLTDLENRIKTQEEKLDRLNKSDDTELLNLLNGKRQSSLKLVDRQRFTEKSQTEKIAKQTGLTQVIDSIKDSERILNESIQAFRESHPDFDSAAAADLLEKCREKFANQENSYSLIIKEIDETLERRRRNIIKLRESITEGLSGYMSTHKTSTALADPDRVKFDSFDQRVRFIFEEKAMLEETTLAEYSEKAEKALIEVERIFRDKFLGHLGERLKKVREDITKLNKSLKGRYFHGEYFQFKVIPAPELMPVHNLAVAFEDDRSVENSMGGLFDPGNDPSSPHYEAISFIKKAFQDEQLGRQLQDFRNYFVFDVEMFTPDGRKVANLKHRIAKGSGGENQAPYYVAIGSSLAAAYQLVQRPGRDSFGGMRLAPFDEAFSKLDTGNIYNCIEFLKDIKLQILLAAPDDKYTTMASQMDTLIWIYKDGGKVRLETEYMKAKGQELLLSDNPFKLTESEESVENGTSPRIVELPA